MKLFQDKSFRRVVAANLLWFALILVQLGLVYLWNLKTLQAAADHMPGTASRDDWMLQRYSVVVGLDIVGVIGIGFWYARSKFKNIERSSSKQAT